jgi:hypothetical protein
VGLEWKGAKDTMQEGRAAVKVTDAEVWEWTVKTSTRIDCTPLVGNWEDASMKS